MLHFRNGRRIYNFRRYGKRLVVFSAPERETLEKLREFNGTEAKWGKKE